jgi:hypothetical protein
VLRSREDPGGTREGHANASCAALAWAYKRLVTDLAFVLIILAFFGLAALFVNACDRIIGSDEEAFADAVPETFEQHDRTAA